MTWMEETERVERWRMEGEENGRDGGRKGKGNGRERGRGKEMEGADRGTEE